MKRWFVVAVFVLAALPGAAEQAQVSAPLPASGAAAGWARTAEPRQFTPKNLYEYIDGAADLFAAYGVVSVAAGEYQAAGDRRITVDIYDMGASLHAFGIFASERAPDARKLGVGVQGYCDSGLTAFWQGPYYVKISQSDAGDQAAALALAKATAAQLPAGAGMPEELKRLPTERRIPDSERYVRESALGHKFLTNDVSAEYRLGKATGELHIVDLGTPDKAAAAWKRLRDFEAKAGKGLKATAKFGDIAFHVKDASFGEMMAVQWERFVVIAFGEKANRAVVTDLVQRACALLSGRADVYPTFDAPARGRGMRSAPAPGSGGK